MQLVTKISKFFQYKILKVSSGIWSDFETLVALTILDQVLKLVFQTSTRGELHLVLVLFNVFALRLIFIP